MSHMTVAQFAYNVDPSYRKIFVDTLKQYPSVAEKFFNVSDTDLYQVKEASNTGFGQVPVKVEAQATTIDRRYNGYPKTYTQISYGLAAEVTREMMDFDRAQSMAKIPSAMGRSVQDTIETLAMNHFNRHINGSYLGPDGVVLCSNSHPLHPQSSGTQDNLGTAGSLTYTTLLDLRLIMAKTTDERALPMKVRPKHLLVPIDLEATAANILQADRKPGTSNWDINFFRGAGLELTASPHISITTAYWLIADKSETGLNIIYSCRPEFNRDKGVSEQVAKWYVYFRLVSGFTHWYGIAGNNGA